MMCTAEARKVAAKQASISRRDSRHVSWENCRDPMSLVRIVPAGAVSPTMRFAISLGSTPVERQSFRSESRSTENLA
jgi:hypothetical protein